MNSFHFIRPWCFFLLLVIPPLLIYCRHQKLKNRSWHRVVDPQLLPHLLKDDGGEGQTRSRSLVPAALCFFFLIGITALAGPAWRKIEQPVFRSTDALVVVLDLSLSMDTEDIKPSRLERVKLKLLDILQQRKDGQTALVVYAANPYVVSPLTSDNATIRSQVKSLSTNLMPDKGSRPDKALAKAAELIRQAGIAKGNILLVSDGLGGVETRAFAAFAEGYRFSVLGVGTLEGGPIPAVDQGFVKDTNGDIVLARLDEVKLRELAKKGSGRYHRLSGDDRDLNYLLEAMVPGNSTGDEAKEKKIVSDRFSEEGPWLVVFLLPFAALVFRRGILVFLLVYASTMPTTARAVEWQDLWLNKNQQAAAALAEKRPGEAAETFTDKNWKAAAHYAAGEYEQVLQNLEGVNHPDVHYNRGNALARLGRLEEALSAYEQAIEDNPENSNAITNREIVKQAIEQQKQQSQQQKRQHGEQQQAENDDAGNSLQGEQDTAQPGDNNPSDAGSSDKQNSAGSKDTQAAAPDKDKPDQSTSPPSTKSSDREDNGPEEQPDNGEAGISSRETEHPGEEEQKQLEQWLRNVPDDPGGLWRRKFQYQYQKQYRRQQEEKQAW